MINYRTKPLDGTTWPDFTRLAKANNGVWGGFGCWCMWYHTKDEPPTPEAKRKAKECLVREGRAHAALVYDGKDCVGWCQFGSTNELPRIHNERACFATNPTLPDWRIHMLLVLQRLSRQRRLGCVVKGAIEQIKKMGGGRIEGYPEDIEDRKASPAFLFNGALSTFERNGFKRSRLIGKQKWVVWCEVAPLVRTAFPVR